VGRSRQGSTVGAGSAWAGVGSARAQAASGCRRARVGAVQAQAGRGGRRKWVGTQRRCEGAGRDGWAHAMGGQRGASRGVQPGPHAANATATQPAHRHLAW